jgi:hypothetical protein
MMGLQVILAHLIKVAVVEDPPQQVLLTQVMEEQVMYHLLQGQQLHMPAEVAAEQIVLPVPAEQGVAAMDQM